MHQEETADQVHMYTAGGRQDAPDKILGLELLGAHVEAISHRNLGIRTLRSRKPGLATFL